jgi:hypothetical protein
MIEVSINKSMSIAQIYVKVSIQCFDECCVAAFAMARWVNTNGDNMDFDERVSHLV